MAVKPLLRQYRFGRYGRCALQIDIVPNLTKIGFPQYDEVTVYESFRGVVTPLDGVHILCPYWEVLRELVHNRTGKKYEFSSEPWYLDDDGNYRMEFKARDGEEHRILIRIIKAPYVPIEFARIEIEYEDGKWEFYQNLFHVIKDLLELTEEPVIQAIDPSMQEEEVNVSSTY